MERKCRTISRKKTSVVCGMGVLRTLYWRGVGKTFRSLWTQVLSRFKLGYTLCAMVEVHADLSPSAETLPILAELVLRKLNLCPGGIAQITQTKTRVPHRHTQEGFGSGVASEHAGFLIPMRLAPSAVLSEQVRVASCATGSAAKQVCVLDRGEMYSTSRAIVQVSDCIRPPITSAPAMRPSARSSLRPTASARFSFQSRYGESLLHGFFRSERSCHTFLHVFKKVQLFLDLAICCGCAVGSSFVAAAPLAIHERHAGCMAGPAGLLTTSRAVVLVAGWIRPQIASAYAMHPSAASSRRPGASPACLACVSLQSRYGASSWQGYLRRVPSQHLVISRQGNTHSLLDLAIAITMPCTCAVKFSLLFAWRGAKHLRDASCMFGPLTTSRAIVQVSGCICPPVSSAHAIRASAASSPSSTAPICFSPQCRDGESLLHGFFRSERSCDPFLHVFKKVQLFLDLALCCGCAVGTSFVAAAPFAIHESHAGCMAGPAGLLTTSRAVVLVAGLIRPQIASAYAMHPSAASSRRPGAAPACLACVSLQSRYGESSWQGYLRRVRSQHLVVSRQGNTHSQLDLAIASTMPCTCAVKFSLLFAWCGAKHLRDASCMFGPLTTSRAIVPVSGCICPPVSSAHAIRAFAASSHRSSTAPICFSPQCRDGESLLHGFFRSERSYHPFLHVFKKVLVQLFLDLAMCCGCAVGSSFVAAAPSANHERDAGCVRSRFVRTGPSAKTLRDASCMSGPLTTGKAAVPVSAWVRPMSASACASRASALLLGGAPVWIALLCRYSESVSRQEGSHVFFLQDLLLGARAYLLLQAARGDAVIRSSGGARWTWASLGMTEPSLLVGMLQPPSPAPSPRAVNYVLRLQGGSRSAFRPHLEAAGDVKNTPSYWEASVSKPSRFLTCPFLAQSAIAAVVRLCPVRAKSPATEYCLIGFGLDQQRPKKEGSRLST